MGDRPVKEKFKDNKGVRGRGGRGEEDRRKGGERGP